MTTKREKDDDKLDETLDETFPASDAPANTVETGIVTGDLAEANDIIDDRARHRFELTIDGQTAFLAYERSAKSLTIRHTEVPPPLRGRHLGERLVEHALEAARRDGLSAVVVCPFAQAHLRRHPRRASA